jgi:ribosomal protein S18 acetylase RimI-like enzyme
VRLTALADRLGDASVHRLLIDAFGSPAVAFRAMERYRSGDWRLYGYVDQSEVVACIGLEPLSPSSARIRGIAVAHRKQRRGIGRSLIGDALKVAGSALVAETDRDAADFYRRCGFVVESLGEQYVGVERFRCTLTRNKGDQRAQQAATGPSFIGAGGSLPPHDTGRAAEEAPYEPRSWR